MQERIVVNPNIHFGKPCVAGTRITVQSVLELVREGLSFAEIIQDYYPELQVEDIRACIQIDESLCGHRTGQAQVQKPSGLVETWYWCR
jgi:uncharacterized protein (DUF433 family)